ncbi:TPA: hypothetical protein ACGOVD_000750 [Streptococcus suis]
MSVDAKSQPATLRNTVTIRKAEPTFDFDKKLEDATNQYDELLKELADR